MKRTLGLITAALGLFLSRCSQGGVDSRPKTHLDIGHFLAACPGH